MAHPHPVVSRRTAALYSGPLLSHLFPASEEDGRAVVLGQDLSRRNTSSTAVLSPWRRGYRPNYRLRASRIRRESVTACGSGRSEGCTQEHARRGAPARTFALDRNRLYHIPPRDARESGESSEFVAGGQVPDVVTTQGGECRRVLRKRADPCGRPHNASGNREMLRRNTSGPHWPKARRRRR